jgi:hypothetical protein
MTSILLSKLIIGKVVKKLAAFYGIWGFITVFVKIPSPDPNLRQNNPIHIL